MSIDQFPFRIIADRAVAAALVNNTDELKLSLTGIIHSVVSIGKRIAWAYDNLSPELFDAWLFSELGWTSRTADAFLDAATSFERRENSFQPAASLEMASILAARSVAAMQLIKARRLLNAYRELMKGELTSIRFLHSCRCRSAIKSNARRVRGRVYRAELRRPGSDSRDSSTGDFAG